MGYRAVRAGGSAVVWLALVAAVGCGAAPVSVDPASTQVPRGSQLDADALDRAIGDIQARLAPGIVGVAVKVLPDGEEWAYNATLRFPMQSVFKAPLAAVVLDAVDRRAMSLSESIDLSLDDLSPPYSPIGAAFPGRRTYTLDELLIAAAGGSDNTAADVLMARVGGPGEVSRWLFLNGVRDLHVHRYEREFQIQMNGMPRFRPEWAQEPAFLAALHAVPEETRRRATAAYIDDTRDSSTPPASVNFLARLAAGKLVGTASTAHLLDIMTKTTTGARRIKAGLPPGATLAHKTGSARPDFGQNPAVNDIGIVTLADGHQFALAVYVAATRMPYQEAEDAIADVTRLVVSALKAP